MNIKATDRITLEILSDGTISIDTDAISEPNHVEAQELVDSTLEALGGARETVHKPHIGSKHGHVHVHGQGHTQVKA